jgi:hypothetical protein
MIVIPSYLHACPKIIPNLAKVADLEGFRFDKNGTDADLVISWGGPVNGSKNWVMETGFFWDACHIDIGLYKNSLLNTIRGKEAIDNFKSPKSAIDVINESGLKNSKYRQVNYSLLWDGVVLALQNPGDRSVLSAGSKEDYYSFVEGACIKYNRHLLLKAHPWNTGEVFERLKSYSDKYGCRIEKTDHECLKNCKFVLVYNSTFAVDCFVRGAKVAQYAPGYFYQTDAVTYTNYYYPDDVNDTCNYGYKLADFLIHRYCLYNSMSTDEWVIFLKHLYNSKDLFPVTEEFSYARRI